MSKEKQNTSEKPSDKTEDVKLSSHLKVQLSKDHRQASTSHFIKDLLRGRIEQKIYQQYVAALYFIYRYFYFKCLKILDFDYDFFRTVF